MDDGEEDRVIAERLPNLGTWEFYLFSLEDSDETVCKVALRAGGADGVEYGVFRGEDGEPSASGAIAQRGSWSDEAREDALKEILTAYGAKLPELRSGVIFDFYGERESDEDEEDDEDVDDDEDEEGDDDA
jgi:hypothetical protein